MSPADLDGLVEDIKQNGLVHRIVCTSDGVVLDGRNRLKASQIAGIDPQFEVYAGSNPVGFIISANLRRRQLNESQRALIATRLAPTAFSRCSCSEVVADMRCSVQRSPVISTSLLILSKAEIAISMPSWSAAFDLLRQPARAINHCASTQLGCHTEPFGV
jgi:hypothetical protein